MNPVLSRFFPASTLTLFLVACGASSTGGEGGGGSGSGGSDGAFDAKCALACKPEKACAGEDATECEQACVTTVKGLGTACAQCIVEHTGWSGEECECKDFEGEQLCTFQPFAPKGSEVSSGAECTQGMAGTGTCDGFSMGQASSSECKDACGSGG